MPTRGRHWAAPPLSRNRGSLEDIRPDCAVLWGSGKPFILAPSHPSFCNEQAWGDTRPRPRAHTPAPTPRRPPGLTWSYRDFMFKSNTAPFCAAGRGACPWSSHYAGPWDRSKPTGPASPQALGFICSVSLFPLPSPSRLLHIIKLKRE